MPGFSIHIAVAKEYIRKNKVKDEQELIRGVIDPDYISLTDKEKSRAGRKLLTEIEGKDIRIRPKCQDAFIMRGSYHMLADELKVGWHIDFLERLKNLLDE